MYRLQRISFGVVRQINVTIDRTEIERDHVRALSRELDTQINYHAREIRISASSYASSITDNLSGATLCSFQIVGEPIFDDDIDDTDSLNVSALRAHFKTGEKQ